MTFMSFAGSAASKARRVFERPYFDIGVKRQMATIRHKFEIFKGVMKRVFIFVMNYLISFKFSAKVLFHHPTVLIHPIFRPYFNLDILQALSIDDSFGKKRDCPGVIHSPHCNTDALPSCFRISGNMKAFFTLARVIVGIAIRSFNRCNRLATNAAGFVCQLLHGQDYMPTQSKKQTNYGGAT